MSVPESIRPRKLSDEVQERLLRLICEERLTPGDALPSERELMARYEIGRPAIREAMQSLQHMGVIEIRHGGRPRVAAPSLDALVEQMGTAMRHLLTHSQSSLGHLKEARVSLEAELARIAAAKRTDEDIADLTALLAKQKSARADGEAFLEIDGRFHRRIAAMSGNPIFETVAHGIFTWMRAFHVEQVRKRGLEALTLAEHRTILDAIAAGNGEAAARSMRDHLDRANALYHQENAT
ncbi:transcriptional regulator NanR [Albidovulum aquaemixtae]|nr:transcriptional regulator NanR [Defluviimonas aquaemixtae]